MNEVSVHAPSGKNSPQVLASYDVTIHPPSGKNRGRRFSVTTDNESRSSRRRRISVTEEQEEETEVLSPPFWRSCCFELDKRFVVFMSQLLISLLIMSFSMYQLTGEHGTCEGSAPYLALISTTVGYWLPQPKM
jgi:hypothetical protein